MTMPLDLILVRHGESEGNLAKKKHREGEGDTPYTPEFCQRHNSALRLTDLGIEQAKMAGLWLKKNVLDTPFNRHYVSEYIRAKETAAHLDLPNAKWYAEFYLGEQNIGALDMVPEDEWDDLFPEWMEHRRLDPFYFSVPGGESMVELCLRIDRVIDTLHRECEGKRVIITCHGRVMWAFRIRLERLSPTQYLHLEESDDPRDKINNCQILHYSRHNPGIAEVLPYYEWMRSVCPSDLSRSSNVWRKIERRTYTNDDLHVQVIKKPRFLAN